VIVMKDDPIADGLMATLSARPGSVAVSLWYDRDRPYLRVYLAPDALYMVGEIPQTYHGYDVVVEKMPDFRFLETH
jgi:hypothetical protein